MWGVLMKHITLILAKQHPKNNPSYSYGAETIWGIANLALAVSLAATIT